METKTCLIHGIMQTDFHYGNSRYNLDQITYFRKLLVL